MGFLDARYSVSLRARGQVIVWNNVLFRLCLLSLLPFVATGAEMWVELGPAANGFSTSARYASRDVKVCPAIAINGRKHAMVKRLPTGSFKALICEFEIPPRTRTARINGKALPLPAWTKKTNPNIVVVGDTGCRIKQGSDDPTAPKSTRWNIQNCDNPADWPFPQVAATAAATKPDLVVHVGDYLYREKACTGVKGCPAGPTGDTLETWEADFFTPAHDLLLAAPWIFVRGNHEDCGRSGDGWFSLLDPRAFKTCDRYSEPYLVTTNVGIQIAVLDTNAPLDPPCKETDQSCQKLFASQTATYTKAFETISSWKLEHAWMVTHRPVWSVKGSATGEIQVLNAVEEAAWSIRRPAGIDLILAGHTHLWEMIGFDSKSGRPMQLVTGNSGTALVPPVKFDSNAPAVQDAAIKSFQKLETFGFTTLSPIPDGWKVEEHDRTGNVKISCKIENRQPTCAKP